jgi:cytidylate kinase
MTLPDIIAIDGPASAGKSTIAAIIAKELGYLYFDTGVMYRAVTLSTLKHELDPMDEEGITRLAETVQIDVREPSIDDGRQYDVILDGEDVTWAIREKKVEGLVSPISAIAGVRKAMTAQQRRIGLRGRVVMVGRDIGTVVLPEAPLKIYLDASAEERARRRFEEVKARGESVEFEEILRGIKGRDQIDSTRKVAPLVAAEDAIRVDTDGQSILQVVEKIKSLL